MTYPPPYHPALGDALDALEVAWDHLPDAARPAVLVAIAAGPVFPSEMAVRATADPKVVFLVMIEAARKFAAAHGIPMVTFPIPRAGIGGQG